uniref:Hemagglutinin protein HagC n=1 Tax=uncultured bacterium contig00070 TaxID=1181551 RepID=A0A806KKG1_9BACT|nr:hemagglutinin protein HagC [uncultured bacterium contig00070]
MRINSLEPTRLRNDAHFQFFAELKNLLEAKNEAGEYIFAYLLDKIRALVDQWLLLFAREDEALKVIRKSGLTSKIQELDAARDDTYNGMVEINTATLKHFSAEKREAAGELKILFDTYGDVAKKPLKDQTSAVYNILQDLRNNKYAPCVATVGLGEWITQLEALNRELEALTAERTSEAAGKTDIVLKEARAEVDRAYAAIVRRIHAHIEIEGSANYENFVRTLNINIAKTVAAIGKRRGKRGENNSEEETEDAQQPEEVI